jgi:hypothetical protein
VTRYPRRLSLMPSRKVMEEKSLDSIGAMICRKIIAGCVELGGVWLMSSRHLPEVPPRLMRKVTRQQLPQLEAAMVHLGAVQSVEFRGVGNQGWDMYDVKQEHGSSQWRIALGADGIITGALVTAGP